MRKLSASLFAGAEVVLLSFVLFGASFAWAQAEEISEVEAERAAPSTVDEITVTGTKSSVTDVQAESQAITAFSMEELDRSNIVNVDQLAFNVPALHVGQQGADSIITLRGVSTENASPTGEAGVQFHVDGVNYARPSAARVAFFDLEGLQVLRGPQGTRGGKNSTAGWINVTTRKPTADFESNVDFQWGSYNQRRLRTALNIPINEYVQTRFAVYMEDRQGYQRNLLLKDKDRDAFDADDFGFRGHLRLLPADSLDVLLSYNYYESNGVGAQEELVGLEPDRRCNPIPLFLGGTGYNPLTNFPAFAGCGANPNATSPAFELDPFTFKLRCPPGRICFPSPVFAATGFDRERQSRFLNFENPATLGEPRDQAVGAAVQPHRLYLDDAASQSNRFWGWTGTLDWEPPSLAFFGDTQLKSITSYQVTHPKRFRDSDGSDLELFLGTTEQNTNQWSQEFQWTGESQDGRLEWMGSLLYMREKTESDTDFSVNLTGIVPLTIDQTAVNKSYGASLATTYHLRDNLSLKLGGRFIKDTKQNRLLRRNPPGNNGAFSTVLAICTGGADDFKGTPQFDANGDPVLLPDGTQQEFSDGIPDDGTPTCKQTFRQVVGDLTLDWWLREENHLYFSVGNGYKGGGFALGESGARNPKSTSLDTYLPEKIWAFMLGSKNSFFDDRLTLNLEGYFYNYRDQQLVLIDGLSVRTDNADSEMLGLDVEFNAEPFPGLRLDGNLAAMDTELTRYDAVDPLHTLVAFQCREEAESFDPNFRRFNPGCHLTDYSGNELTRAPKLSYTLGAEYDIYLGRFGTLTPRIQFYWNDETWFRPFNKTGANSGRNTPCPVVNPVGGCEERNGEEFLLNAAEGQDLQESYHYTDIKLTWTSPSETWTFEAFAQNLEDTVVFQNLLVSTPLLNSPQLAWYGHPRIYGFRVGFSY